jgi:7-cyano-7-deazaguanine synthase
MKDAVVLLSGGLDSTTTLAIAQERGFTCHALSFSYGQRHAVELDAARRVAIALGAVEHQVAEVDLRWIGGSALTADVPVPKDRDVTAAHDIPVTYVPARNTVFLSFALAWAEVLGASTIFIGVNALDYSGYPDCRPEYLLAFERMANLATKAAVTGTRISVCAPLISLSKADIIRRGHALGIDYSMTSSCYDPQPSGACGACDSCVLRANGFSAAEIPDPTLYAGGSP